MENPATTGREQSAPATISMTEKKSKNTRKTPKNGRTPTSSPPTTNRARVRPPPPSTLRRWRAARGKEEEGAGEMGEEMITEWSGEASREDPLAV